jgi:ABC-type bacteriocin/lantibiotic exporter with double-glycine peptidase domain
MYYVFYEVKNVLVNKMKPWARFKLLDLVMKVNNDVFSEINFTKLNSPIHRVADLIASIIADLLAYMLPNLLYVLVIGVYFLYLSPMLAVIFLIGNVIVGLYYYLTYKEVLKRNQEYEDEVQETDGILIDLLSNMDKIVYRGRTSEESKKFEEVSDKNAKLGMDYYSNSNKNATTMTLIMTFTFFVSLSYLIKLHINKKISHVAFMSSLTILTLFREKMSAVVEQLPDFMGYIGRMDIAMKYFDHVNLHFEKVLQPDRFTKKEVTFEKVKFENVTYKYSSGKYVFKNKNLETTLNNHDIVGITGPSGSGKSTFVKMMIRMYPCEEGDIYIDGVNVKDLDPLYIRKNVTYVNQTSKLFDKKVIDNMMYGCSDKDKCEAMLKKVMQYPTISKLYKNMDIHTKESGLLGENLSGGQRQVVNMIGGFINPSRILVLDEPTNALDPILKKEVIQMITDFKQYKQCILIITHDKEVFNIFDRELKLG